MRLKQPIDRALPVNNFTLQVGQHLVGQDQGLEAASVARRVGRLSRSDHCRLPTTTLCGSTREVQRQRHRSRANGVRSTGT